MIQTQSVLRIVDNSGAKNVQCIKVLKGFKRKTAYIGDTIVSSIIKIKSKNKANSKVQKGDVLRAVIIRTVYRKNRKDGSYLKFNNNAAILINNQNKPVGTRILSLVPKEFKTEKLMKIASLSSGFL